MAQHSWILTPTSPSRVGWGCSFCSCATCWGFHLYQPSGKPKISKRLEILREGNRGGKEADFYSEKHHNTTHTRQLLCPDSFCEVCNSTNTNPLPDLSQTMNPTDSLAHHHTPPTVSVSPPPDCAVTVTQPNSNSILLKPILENSSPDSPGGLSTCVPTIKGADHSSLSASEYPSWQAHAKDLFPSTSAQCDVNQEFLALRSSGASFWGDSATNLVEPGNLSFLSPDALALLERQVQKRTPVLNRPFSATSPVGKKGQGVLTQSPSGITRELAEDVQRSKGARQTLLPVTHGTTGKASQRQTRLCNRCPPRLPARQAGARQEPEENRDKNFPPAAERVSPPGPKAEEHGGGDAEKKMNDFLQWFNCGIKCKRQENSQKKGSSTSSAQSRGLVKKRAAFMGMITAQKIMTDAGKSPEEKLGHWHVIDTTCPREPLPAQRKFGKTQQKAEVQARAEPIQGHPSSYRAPS
ncbi:hypothetical protein HPG69_007666, partial [Diceros bicornis minor]